VDILNRFVDVRHDMPTHAQLLHDLDHDAQKFTLKQSTRCDRDAMCASR
jgi:hypothetical protein